MRVTGQRILAAYREPSHARSVFELIITAGPFCCSGSCMLAALDVGYWLSLIIACRRRAFSSACS